MSINYKWKWSDIVKFINDIIDALLYLHSNHFEHGNITLNDIYYNFDSEIFILANVESGNYIVNNGKKDIIDFSSMIGKLWNDEKVTLLINFINNLSLPEDSYGSELPIVQIRKTWYIITSSEITNLSDLMDKIKIGKYRNFKNVLRDKTEENGYFFVGKFNKKQDNDSNKILDEISGDKSKQLYTTYYNGEIYIFYYLETEGCEDRKINKKTDQYYEPLPGSKVRFDDENVKIYTFGIDCTDPLMNIEYDID